MAPAEMCPGNQHQSQKLSSEARQDKWREGAAPQQYQGSNDDEPPGNEEQKSGDFHSLANQVITIHPLKFSNTIFVIEAIVRTGGGDGGVYPVKGRVVG